MVKAWNETRNKTYGETFIETFSKQNKKQPRPQRTMEHNREELNPKLSFELLKFEASKILGKDISSVIFSGDVI
jgi:hypothetical protein